MIFKRQIMEVKDRIKAILEYYHLSVNEFVTQTRVKTGQAVYDLLSGKTKSISQSMEDKILSCFQDINRAWLLTGEGEMIKQSVQQMLNGDNNTQIAGNNNHVNLPSTLDKAINEIAEQRKLVAKSQEQIDRLISLLERR